MTKMEKSEQINELATALSKAQGEFQPVPKMRSVDFIDKKGNRVKYNYADLQDIINMAQPRLAKFGLSVTQLTAITPQEFILETMLMHSSGQFIKSTYPLRTMERNQEQGSEITYARRYALSAILGIHSEEDDDGAAANASNQSTYETTKPSVNAPKINPRTAYAKPESDINAELMAASVQPDQNYPPLDFDDFKDDAQETGPADYVFNFGKWNGKSIKDFKLEELEGYAFYLENMAARQNKPVSASAKNFLDALASYKSSMGY